jgi:hypothetical protein
LELVVAIVTKTHFTLLYTHPVLQRLQI